MSGKLFPTDPENLLNLSVQLNMNNKYLNICLLKVSWNMHVIIVANCYISKKG